MLQESTFQMHAFTAYGIGKAFANRTCICTSFVFDFCVGLYHTSHMKWVYLLHTYLTIGQLNFIEKIKR